MNRTSPVLRSTRECKSVHCQEEGWERSLEEMNAFGDVKDDSRREFEQGEQNVQSPGRGEGIGGRWN